ncbi:hypothetical protein BC937DRAFT_93786, partial [Endogone sp. FLAS-F59071]
VSKILQSHDYAAERRTPNATDVPSCHVREGSKAKPRLRKLIPSAFRHAQESTHSNIHLQRPYCSGERPSLLLRRYNTVLRTHDSTLPLFRDADGQVLVWDLKTRRTTVKWKAHKDSVLSIQEWGANRLITHGRDNNIHVWDCTNLESLTSGNPLFSLPVNALNFCKFSTCSPENDDDDLLIAVPSILDSSMIDIFSLRHQTRLWAHIGLPPFPESSSPPSEQPAKAGLCMALRLFWRDKQLYLLAGYENGGLAFWRLQKGETIVEGEGTDARRVVVKDGVREKVWEVKEHKEVVLAIDVSPDMCHALSTSADDKIVKYSLYDNPSSNEIIAGSVTLKHPGVSDVRIRSDGRIFATGGWDGRWVGSHFTDSHVDLCDVLRKYDKIIAHIASLITHHHTGTLHTA